MADLIEDSYELAQRRYAELGVDTGQALQQLQAISISLHCWQADDVGGFERTGGKLEGGGLQVTGNYPGKPRNIAEIRQDLEKVFSLIPGKHRLNLHAIYGEFGDQEVDRNEITPEHFQGWVDWAKEQDLKLDLNPTPFSHPKAASNLTLSSKSPEIRDFWIEHVRRSREISNAIGSQLGSPCIHNIWIPDGIKDIPVDRAGYRQLLKEALDDIFSTKYPAAHVKDSLEGKLFGIGAESFTVGSHEFYLSYAVANQLMLTLDTGHYHPTESVADKISAILPFVPELLLHLSRGVRWDSDHVAILDEQLVQIAEEVVKCKALDRVHLATDYFDGSINRIAAYVIGVRAVQEAFLYALLEPWDLLREHEEQGRNFQRLAMLEEMKVMPFGAVWDYFCQQGNVPPGGAWIEEVEKYEKDVLFQRT
ncbi:MAG TPA: L-rhamnose isomerase [Candidatus Lokiarchaeia archaeon]|nr:L-rhamnose isomerase [Candidatus Lokiarchaeia archaeon]